VLDEKYWKIDQNSKIEKLDPKTISHQHPVTTIKRTVGGKRIKTSIRHFDYSFPTGTQFFQCGVFTFAVVYPSEMLPTLLPWLNLPRPTSTSWAPSSFNFRVEAYCYGDWVWQCDIVDCGDAEEAVRSALTIKGHGTGERYDVDGEVRVYELWGGEVNDITHTETITFRYPNSWHMVFEDLQENGYFERRRITCVDVDNNGSDDEHLYLNWASNGRPCLEINFDYESKKRKENRKASA